MFEDKFKCLILVFAIIDLIECMPLSEIALSAKFNELKSFNFGSYNKLLNVIIQLTPKRIEYKFKTFLFFFKFILLNSSLKDFAFS